MSATFEASLDELSFILDDLVREFAATNNKHRRTEIAAEFLELTSRFSAITSPSSPRGIAGSYSELTKWIEAAFKEL